jgi:hypothetical protein
MDVKCAASRTVSIRLGMASHEGQRLDVAVGDAAGVGTQDAAGERGVLVVLHHAACAAGCQRLLDSVRSGSADRA